MRAAPPERPLRQRSRGAVLALALAACSRPPAEQPQSIVLVRPRFPTGDAPFVERVYLNEALTFAFSEPIDRASVTTDSVRVADEQGVEARGTLEVVQGSSVRFVPRLPTSPELTDAGLQPGRRYSVELAGFPRLDGLRSISGHPLAASLRTSFTTVPTSGPNGEPRSWLLFDDVPGKPGVLKLFPAPRGPLAGGYVVANRGAIVLSCDRPVDPTSLDEHDFVLQRSGGGAPLEVSVRLIENEPRMSVRPRPKASRARALAPGAWENLARAALIEIVPLIPPSRETLVLSIKTDTSKRCRLLDLSGQPVIWPSGQISVQFGDAGAEAAPGTFVEEFLRTPAGSMRSQSPVPGFDGTATWKDSGRVEVRYPAAAGDGSDGAVDLGEDEPRAEIHATHLELAAERTCRLSTSAPTCVLRSQGSITISGVLTRDAPGAATADPDPDLLQGSGATLSSWLARVQAGEQAWTVLVAGGDLSIEGTLRVDTPLLLCAGGMIRIPGRVVGTGTEQSGNVWILGDGGGLDVSPRPNQVRNALVVDEPQGANPLRKPLRLCVMSQAVPQRGSVARWLFAEARGSSDVGDTKRNGTWRVRYLPASAVASSLASRASWFDDPASLAPGAGGSAESLVFLIELDVPIGGRWDPPFIDSLRLAWDEREGGAR